MGVDFELGMLGGKYNATIFVRAGLVVLLVIFCSRQFIE